MTNFLDGDFSTGKECEYHCSPTCHPGQLGPEWRYGCLHPDWPANKHNDFCPLVDCDGDPARCELPREFKKGDIVEVEATVESGYGESKNIEVVHDPGDGTLSSDRYAQSGRQARKLFRFPCAKWIGMMVGKSVRITGIKTFCADYGGTIGAVEEQMHHEVWMVIPLCTCRYVVPSACLLEDLTIVEVEE